MGYFSVGISCFILGVVWFYFISLALKYDRRCEAFFEKKLSDKQYREYVKLKESFFKW